MSTRTITVPPNDVQPGDVLTLRQGDVDTVVGRLDAVVRDEAGVVISHELVVGGAPFSATAIEWAIVDATREVPSYAPGTVGMATVRGVPGIRVFRCEDPVGEVWASATIVDHRRAHGGEHITDLVLEVPPSRDQVIAAVARGRDAYFADEEETQGENEWIADEVLALLEGGDA